MKKRSQKIAYDGDVFEACELTDEAIVEILTPNQKGRRYTALNPRPDMDKSKSKDSSMEYLPEPPSQKRMTMAEKSKTVSFTQG